MGLATDIFNGNGWGLIEYQEEVVEVIEFLPQLLGQLGIFEPIYSRSSNIAIAYKDGVLTLIPTSELGAPPVELVPHGSQVKIFQTVRLAKGSTIMAVELAGVAALPLDIQVAEIATEVTERTQAILNDLELTWEHMRFGAIQGIVYDADGVSVLHNWFTEWGIAQPAMIDFPLDDPDADLRAFLRDIGRTMEDKSGGSWAPNSEIGALCGNAFFDKLLNHKSIKETRLADGRGAELENVRGYASVVIENIRFINYRGSATATSLRIPTDEVRFFPINVRGAFKVGFGPANEFKPYLNQRGREYVGLLLADPSGRDAWDRTEVYSYPIMICTRPGMLLRGRIDPTP